MNIFTRHFKGFYQNEEARTAEQIQLLVADNQLEQDLLAWMILPHEQVVEDDPAREGYVVEYRLGKYLGDGLFVLKITCRDASNVRHQAEIAAGLAVTSASAGGRSASFIPMWFISKELHFVPQKQAEADRPCYGRLEFASASRDLPHRRLFGVAVLK